MSSAAPTPEGKSAMRANVYFESDQADERLARAAEFLSTFDASTEVLVVGPQRSVVDDFLRETPAPARATFGLHRFGILQLASRLASHVLIERGLSPATQLGQEALVARTAFHLEQKQELPQLSQVSHFPGFARAVSRSLGELRLAQLPTQKLEEMGGSTAELALLQARFGEELESARIADAAQLLLCAIEGLESTPFTALTSSPALFLDLEPTSELERRFLRALCERVPHFFATGVFEGSVKEVAARAEFWKSCGARCQSGAGGDTESSDLARLRRYLFSSDQPTQLPLGGEVFFFSAPGEGRECIELARRVLAQARQGIPFDRMAVFLRSPELYSGLLEAAFRRAGIPVYFSRGTLRPDPAGRAFLALLACCADGLSAKRFAEYLSLGQVPTLDAEGAPPRGRSVWRGPADAQLGAVVEAAERNVVEEPEAEPLQQGFLDFGGADSAETPTEKAATAPTSGSPQKASSVEPTRESQRDGTLQAPWKWEELLVEAAIIGGADRWRRRLDGLRRELTLHIEALEREEPESSRLRALEREREQLEHLSRFAMPVIEDLAAFPAEATWGEWLERLATLAPVVLRKPERVLAVLCELEAMAEVGPVSIAEVREVLADRLTSLERDPPAHRYGRVFVATPDQARGRSFDVVFLPGLAERIFPQRPREDPLLLDPVRRSLGAGLHRQEDRSHQERLRLRLAVGATRQRLHISYPRVDVAEARQRVPSFYALDVARATRGMLPDFEQLERDAARDGQARLAWPAPPNPDDAIDAVEHDLSVLGPLLQETPPEEAKWRARYLLELNEHLAHSLRARWVRWCAQRWSPEDGLVRVREETRKIIESQSLKARPYSVSALQRYAVCPYKFLLGSIQRLEPRRQVAPLEQLDALTKGSLFHEVQANFFRQATRDDLLPIRPQNLQGALELLGATLDAVAARYHDDLSPAIERVWQDEIESLRADLRAWLHRTSREQGDWRPTHFELGFGLGVLAAESCDVGSQKEPVKLEQGWLLRGAVDLVESTPSQLRVTDHKTGSSAHIKEYSVVGQGEVLQPILYSFVVEALLKRPVESARLFFCTARGGYREHNVELNEMSRRIGNDVLAIIERAVGRGMLPPAPRKDACKFCDFRSVCGPNEETRQLKKRRDAKALAELDAIRSLP